MSRQGRVHVERLCRRAEGGLLQALGRSDSIRVATIPCLYNSLQVASVVGRTTQNSPLLVVLRPPSHWQQSFLARFHTVAQERVPCLVFRRRRPAAHAPPLGNRGRKVHLNERSTCPRPLKSRCRLEQRRRRPPRFIYSNTTPVFPSTFVVGHLSTHKTGSSNSSNN